MTAHASTSRLLTRALVSVALFLVSSLGFAQVRETGQSQFAAGNDSRSLTVTGIGSVTTVPDNASFSVGVVTTNPSASVAVAENAARANQLFQILANNGIADEDMQTSYFNIYPVFDNGGQTLRHYQVTNTVSVRVRNIDGLGALLDQLIGAGANRLNGIQFLVSNAGELHDQAMRAAVQDARRTAELLAAEAGVTVGSVLGIFPNSNSNSGSYRYEDSASFDSSTPIAEGSATIRASVTIVFEIQ